VTNIADDLSAGAAVAAPFSLAGSTGIAFRGAMPYGEGFFLDEREALALFDKNPACAAVVRPYLGGEDLNTQPDQRPTRFAIDFQRATLDECMERFPECLAIIEERVKPQRLALPENNSTAKQRRRYWWLFSNDAGELRKAILGLSRVIAIPRVSKHMIAAFVPTGDIFSEQLVVVASPEWGMFAVL
jgi:hypothetical protein